MASRSISHLWSLGFGNVNREILIYLHHHHNLSGSGGLIATVLVANSRHILLSFLYFSYSGIFTCMLMGEEWSGYAHRRKPLRVTSPSEEQRGSYYLQLPYRWSVPLLVCSGLLHWLVSQPIFLARVIVLDSQENVVPGSISTCGYSPVAIIFAICLGALLVLIGIICGFRKSKGGMHFAGSCSGAVSAACRPSKSDVNASMKPVMWGVVENEINSKGGEIEIGHCSFTSFNVSAPVSGKHYAGI